MNSLRNEMLKAWNLSIFRRTIRKYGRQEYYRAFLLTLPASLQIYLKNVCQLLLTHLLLQLVHFGYQVIYLVQGP